MRSIFTLQADDPQTPSSLSSKKPSEKHKSPLPKQKKTFFQLQSKTNQTRPDQTNNHQKREPKKKETTHFRLSQVTTNFHYSTTTQ
jgi:hypothetical protein